MWTPALQKQTIKTQNAVIVNGLNQYQPTRSRGGSCLLLCTLDIDKLES
jgi:hypothetical protein